MTEVLHFGREHVGESEGFPSEQAVIMGERQTAIRHSAARHRVLKALLLFCALQLVGCAREQQPSPEIVAEINTLQERTLAPSSSLQSPARISKHQMSVQAEWQIGNSSPTKEYFDWVKQRLGADYHVVSQTESVLIMGKRLDGDTWRLEFKSDPSGSSIVVHLLAMGD